MVIDLLTDCLAAYRLTRAVTMDRIGQPIRSAAIRHGELVGYYVQCNWCLSLAAGFAVICARGIAPRVWRPISQALTFSAITGLLSEHSDRLS